MKTKELIFNKALKLFIEHGYDGTTTNMICRKIGINKNGFVIHFNGKEELLEAMFARCKDMFVQENPTLEQRKQMAETLSLQETLNLLIDKYISIWENQQHTELWQIVCKEQYRNNDAGKIILEETNTRIERLTATFDHLQKLNKMIPCNSLQVATSFIYSIRAQHLDYVLSKLYLPDSQHYIESIYHTAKIVNDLYIKE